jgi:hypothetical protein
MNRSMEAIVWAMKARGLTPTAWKLLLKLCDRVNNERDDFDVWPSQKLIAHDCEISVATVKRHLQELVDEGYVRVIGQFDERTNSKTVNRYRIQVRTRSVMPKEFISIEPEGRAQPEPGYGAGVNSPIAQSELGGEFTRELTEPTKSITYPNEPNPSLPSEETPPSTALMLIDEANHTLATAKPSLIEYVKDGWEKLCADYPRTHKIQAWTDARKKTIARRAAEIVRDAKGGIDAYQVWDMMFAAIRQDSWLRGEGQPTDRYPIPFALDIDYILRVSVFARTLEKAAVHELDTRTTRDAATGRTFGPAEQAGRDAFEIFRARGQQGGRSGNR